jgi:hypothetical protein|tara:strand:+ start:260 stop:433 length:174 start_codon:yes stop_codon:yes gene_type:complete
MRSVTIYKEENYCIVSSYTEDAKDLAGKVEGLLNEGWILSGGLTASSSMLFQALTKI